MSAALSEELKFALELLRKDSLVPGLVAQLEAKRAEVADLRGRLNRAKQQVEELGIENEWLHALINDSCGYEGATSTEPSPDIKIGRKRKTKTTPPTRGKKRTNKKRKT